MRNLAFAALLVATPVAAQPVTQPKACQVTIARAPEDVRAVVEAWVKSEPQCSVALEVRIVPTEGGLYLLAQDEQGRMRERIVPDAQTAGVLVASWIADDNAPVPPPIAAPAAPTAEPVVYNESISPPGLAPIALSATAPPPLVRRSKWITLGALFPMGEGAAGGLRLEVDVWRRGNWIVGGAISAGSGEMRLQSSYGTGYIEATDYKLIGYVARPAQRGKWQLRPALGVGAIYTEGVAYDGNSMFYGLSGTFATAEASFMVSRDVGKSWAAYGGPLATIIVQEFTSYASQTPYAMQVARGNVDFVLFAGVRRRL
jgi:hypothetical protein